MPLRRSTGTRVSQQRGADRSVVGARGRALPPRGLLAALPPPVRERLLAAAVERRFAAGEVIYTAGSPARGLFLILEGRVRLLRAGGGRPFVLHVEGAGGTLGEVPLFESMHDTMHDPGDDPERVTRYPATAVAAEPTRCLVLPREVVRGAVRTEPDVALALLARLAGRVRHLVERMDRRAGMSTLGRLATLLLARHRAAQGGAFVLGRSQLEAAEELGTVRELVVRGLRTLRRGGVIRALGRGRYVVSDEAALRRIASDRVRI